MRDEDKSDESKTVKKFDSTLKKKYRKYWKGKSNKIN